MAEFKKCSKCKEVKSTVGWHKKLANKDGLDGRCPSCKKILRKQAYDRNTDKAKQDSLEWYKENLDRAEATRRAYALSHSADATRRHREWVSRNPQRAREVAILYQNRRRSANRVDYSAKELLARLSVWDFRCWMCGKEYSCVEHVKPLAKGGWDCLSNVRPSCTKCNLAKGATWPFDTKKGY